MEVPVYTGINFKCLWQCWHLTFRYPWHYWLILVIFKRPWHCWYLTFRYLR